MSGPYTPSYGNPGSQSHPNASGMYVNEQLNSMSPMQVLFKLYDICIEACAREDRKRASRAVIEMISALDFEYEEMASRFLRVYRSALVRVNKRDFDGARAAIQSLRDAWVEAIEANGGTAEVPETSARRPGLDAEA